MLEPNIYKFLFAGKYHLQRRLQQLESGTIFPFKCTIIVQLIRTFFKIVRVFVIRGISAGCKNKTQANLATST